MSPIPDPPGGNRPAASSLELDRLGKAPLHAEHPSWRHRLAWIASPHRLSPGVGQIVYALLLIVPLVWLVGYLFPPINHDVGAELDVARRWLAGEKLYVDIIDINTPAVFLLHAIPELLARGFGGSGATWMMICVIVAVVASFLACWRAIELIPSAQHPLTQSFLPPTVLFLLAVLPNDTFGQREHLMVIATLPYLLLSAARAEGARLSLTLRVGVALAAGIGFTLKPHFLVLPLLVELYIVRCTSWHRIFRDVVPWCVGGVTVAHVLFVLVATPEYVTFLIPVIMQAYTAVGDGDVVDVLMGPLIGPTILALIPLAAASLFLSRSRLTRVVMLYAVGAVIECAAQAKGWKYQSMPALSATLLLASATIAEMIDRFLPQNPVQQRLPVAVVTATFMILFYYQQALFNPPFYKQIQFEDSVTDILIHIVNTEAPNKRILVLSPGIYPHYPLVNYTGARMTMRFQTMWVLQGVYANCQEFAPLYNDPAQMSEAEKFVFNTVSDDFARQRPDLVIVDKVAGIPRCQWRSFDYLEYFMRNPTFQQAFQRYRLYMEFDRYAIYKRR